MGESDFRDGHLKLECAKRSTKRRKVSREKLWRASRDPRSKSTHRFPGQKCNRRRKLDGHANDIAPPVNFTGTSEICACQENAASLHHCYNIRIISHLTAPSIWNLISTSGTSSSSSHSFSSPTHLRQRASETAAWRPKASRISNQDETSRAGGNLTKTLSRMLRGTYAPNHLACR